MDSFSLEFVVAVITAIVIGALVLFLYFFGGKLWTFLKRSLFRSTRYGSTSCSPSPFPEPAPAETGKIGLAVVIANEYEGKNRLAGTAKDKELWEAAFKKLNFDVRTSRGVGLNSSKEEMLRLIDLLNQVYIREGDVRKSYRHIAFVFSGHGYDGGIYSQHEKCLDLKKEVFPRIFHDKRDTFNKLIFVDACRTSIDDGKGQKSLKISSEMIPKSRNGDGVSGGVGAFIAYATLNGRFAPDSRDGSNFSKCVTKWLQKDETIEAAVTKATAEIERMPMQYYARSERINLLSGVVNLYRESLEAAKSLHIADGAEEDESSEINGTALHREPPSTDPGENVRSEVEDQDSNLDPNLGTSPTSSTASTDANFTVDCPTQPHHSRSEPPPNAENSATNVLTSDEPLLQFVTPKVDATPHDDFLGGRRCDERKVNSPSEDVMNKPRMAKSIHHTSAHVVGHEARECRSEEFTDPNILTIKSLMLYLPELASLGLQLSGWLDMGSAWAAIVKTPGTPQDHVQKLLTQWLSDEEDPDIPHTWTHFIEVVRGCKRGKLAGKMEREVLGREHEEPSAVEILDCRPSDQGLLEVTRMLPQPQLNEVAVRLGVPFHIVADLGRHYISGGMRVLMYWRDGMFGPDYPVTWRFLLDAVSKACGPGVAGQLEREVLENRQSWCESIGTIEEQTGGPPHSVPSETSEPSKNPEHQFPVLRTTREFMEYFQQEFLAEDVVDGRMIADKLFAGEVIPQSLRYRLMRADDDYQVASDIFNYMKEQGDYASLKRLCEIMLKEDGMKAMNKLGKKMLECLEANKGLDVLSEPAGSSGFESTIKEQVGGPPHSVSSKTSEPSKNPERQFPVLRTTRGDKRLVAPHLCIMER